MRLLGYLERATDAAAILGVLLIVPLVLAMVFEVLSRYLLNAPTIWAFEVSYMMMAGIFSFGFAYALKERQHVNVDFIYGMLGPRMRAVVDLVGYVLFLPCILWLSKALFDYALGAYRSGEVSGLSAWNPVVWPLRTALFLGFAVLSLQVIVEVAKCVRTILRGGDEDEPRR